jgi:methionyl-tRNA synthetase
MLMSAGLRLPKTILVHGLIMSDGRKMSKSLGNVIDPYELINEYGADALRYYFAREVSPFEDGDLTKEQFKAVYNANLANGLGNLLSRVVKMSSSYGVTADRDALSEIEHNKAVRESEEHKELYGRYIKALEAFEINKAADEVWKLVAEADAYIQREQPFKKIKTDPEAAKKDIVLLLHQVYTIGKLLEPIMPETSTRIRQSVIDNAVPEKSLFPRKD